MKMKRQLYFPLILTLLASLVSGVLPLGQGVAYASPGWVSPTGEVLNGWGGSGLAWDDDTGTSSSYDAAGASWTPYIELTHASLQCTSVQVWVGAENDNMGTVEVDVYYSSAWDNIYSGPPTLGSFVEYTIGSEQAVTAMRIRCLNSHSVQPRFQYVFEADFYEVVPLPSISNTPSTWDVNSPNPVAENTTYETGLTHFTLTNNSSFAINVTISGEDMTGAGETWTLSNDGTNGTSTYGLKVGLSGTSYNIVVRRDPTYNNLVTNMAGGGTTQQWGLQLLTPTTFGDGTTKSGTVTLTATQA